MPDFSPTSNPLLNWLEDWDYRITYEVNDLVRYSGRYWVCLVAHKADGADDATKKPPLDSRTATTYWEQLDIEVPVPIVKRTNVARPLTYYEFDANTQVIADIIEDWDDRFDNMAIIDGDQTLSGNKTFENNVVIQGTLSVATIVSNVSTTDNIVELNVGESGSEVTAGSAGFEIDRGTGASYHIIFDEADNTFKVGFTGNLHKVWNAGNDGVGSGLDADLFRGYDPDDFSFADHLHDGRYYTETELDDGVLDARYYTEIELDAGQLNNLYYTEDELDNGALDDRYYRESEVDALLAPKIAKKSGVTLNALPVFTSTGDITDSGLFLSDLSVVGHEHDSRYFTETELTNGQLDTRYYTQSLLNGGQLDTRYYTKSQVDTALDLKLTKQSVVIDHLVAANASGQLVDTGIDYTTISINGHNHNDLYYAKGQTYTQTEVNNLLSTKQPLFTGEGGNVVIFNAEGNPVDSTVDISTISRTDHNHNSSYYTKTELQTGILNTVYYTETELNNGQLDTRYYTQSLLNGGQLDTRYYTKTLLNDGQLDSRYYTRSEVNGLLTDKSDTDHEHDTRYYTETEIDAALALKSATSHNHNDTYYTENELDGGQLDSRYYTIAQLNTSLSGKSDTDHIHDDRYYTETEIDAALLLKSDVGHTHDDRYYTEDQVDSMLAGKLSAITAIPDNRVLIAMDGQVSDSGYSPQDLGADNGGQVNDNQNVGTGEGLIYRNKEGAVMYLRSLKAGNNISITTDTNDILISAPDVEIDDKVKIGATGTSTYLATSDFALDGDGNIQIKRSSILPINVGYLSGKVVADFALTNHTHNHEQLQSVLGVDDTDTNTESNKHVSNHLIKTMQEQIRIAQAMAFLF